MILCLDVGNSQIFGGIFNEGDLKLRFRRDISNNNSSDELGLFLKGVLRENNINPDQIQKIALCSVVPDILHSLNNCCLKYLKIKPFILGPGVRSGIKIKYRNPLEVGTDRIANSIAATCLYPDRNLIVIDFGTATTFCVISKKKEHLGGIISAGVKISMKALEKNTAKLPTVEIIKPLSVVGRSTVESIQSGLYYSTLGMIKEIVRCITADTFSEDPPLVIGTGGFSRLFQDQQLFHHIDPDLVLKGLYLGLSINGSIPVCRRNFS